jgi:hypothetical protein
LVVTHPRSFTIPSFNTQRKFRPYPSPSRTFQ